MSKLQNNQQGFNAVETVLIIVIIAIVAFIGGFVWHSKQTADKTLTPVSSSSSTVKKQPAKTTTAGTTTPPGTQAQVLDCLKHASAKPTDIVLTCADANTVAENITWSSWTATGAAGSGDMKANDCTPDCADGHFHTYPASFSLSGAQKVGQTTYLTALSVKYTGSYPGQGSTESYSLSTR